MRSANLFFFTQPQETFEDWYQAQQNTPFEEKEEPFFVEIQQIPVNYGTITDTAYQDSLYWKEQHLYGSSRLGIAKPELEVTNHTPSNASTLTTNFKNYELTNHLGNILATIKDEKQQIDQNADGIVDYYEPIVITANDYYPFGMLMPNRSFSIAGSGYRFGFNGKEKESDIYGESNAYDFGARIYASRLGRWLSVDKKFQNAPYLTPYNFGANNPIVYIDPDGNTEFYFNGKWIGSDGKEDLLIGIVTDKSVKKDIEKNKNYPSNITNGKAFKGGFALNYDVIKESVNVLNKAIKDKDKLVEHNAVMKKAGDGFNTTHRGVSEEGKEGNKTMEGGSIPEGDVSIHSHPLKAYSDNGVTKSYDANTPSPEPYDEKTFKKYETNIIVGKNGLAGGTIETDPITGKKESTINDNREESINVFDSNSKSQGSVSKKDADAIIKDYENR